ncbi:hypothetical protein LCGC14_1584220 [marine sediment metagenome]|uniref:Uncharacterized protein n=1 Tax=marine sediment metagenome TaxID=412755 RepID=A0A0F9LGD1_9ZZZZ
MRRKTKKSQGAIFVWVFALLFLFLISLVYIVMTKPFIAVRDLIGPNFTGTEFQPTFDKINTYWVVWPILLLTSVFIWAIMVTLKDKSDFPRL